MTDTWSNPDQKLTALVLRDDSPESKLINCVLRLAILSKFVGK
jgi:hypothetical protein